MNKIPFLVKKAVAHLQVCLNLWDNLVLESNQKKKKKNSIYDDLQ